MISLHERGQLFSSDALLAMVVFLFALTVTFALTDQLVVQTNESAENIQLNHTTARLAQTLVSSPGNPSNWEYLSDRNNVREIGLVGNGREISTKKWSSFRDWNGSDYPSLKQSMGIGDKNFYFYMTDTNKNVIAYAGISPANARRVSGSTFATTYLGEPVMATLQVYQT